MDASTIRHNALSENLGADVIAVDEQGNILTRAADEATARRAAPTAVVFFTGADFQHPAPAPTEEMAAKEPVVSDGPAKTARVNKTIAKNQSAIDSVNKKLAEHTTDRRRKPAGK